MPLGMTVPFQNQQPWGGVQVPSPQPQGKQAMLDSPSPIQAQLSPFNRMQDLQQQGALETDPVKKAMMGQKLQQTGQGIVNQQRLQDAQAAGEQDAAKANAFQGAFQQPPFDPRNARREHGGPVEAGVPYLVGEAGPEIVTPKQDGMVIPNKPSEDMLSAFLRMLQQKLGGAQQAPDSQLLQQIQNRYQS